MIYLSINIVIPYSSAIVVKTFRLVPYLLVICLLFLAWRYNYLLFHTSVEFLVTLVALSLPLLVWNARKILNNNFFVFVSIAHLSVGIINYFHLISYQGMPVFPNFGSYLSSQLWLAQRFILVPSLIFAFFFINRRLNEYITIVVYALITLLFLLSIYIWQIFPITYVDGVGLTPFKVLSEYFISFLFLISIILLHRYRNKFDPETYRLLLVAFILNGLAELIFTLYTTLFEFIIMVAHTLIFFSYYFVYRAIIRVGLAKPYQLLFSEIQYMNQQKDELLHIASHELKTPLTNIKVYSQILNKRIKGGKNALDASHILEQIQNQTNRLSRIINDMNDIGKIETGYFSLKKTELDLYDLTLGIVREFKRSYPDRKIIIHKHRPILVVCDRDRISQVLVNLIANALKYSPSQKPVTINLKRYKTTAVVSVRDRGIGIEKDKLQHIFEKYYRTSQGERRTDGLGLGLYISKEIIEHHRGRIWVESIPLRGSTFCFSLPLS